MANQIRRLSKWWNRFYKNRFLNGMGYYSHKKRNSTSIKDTQLCEIYKDVPRHIQAGNKIITVRGYGSIMDLKNDEWFIVGLGQGKEFNIEHTVKTTKQFYVRFKNIKGKYTIYPLLFGHYKYMDQSLDTELGEVFITKKKYASLTKEEISKRKHIPYFNTNARGKDILKQLRENNLLNSIIKSN